MLPLAKTLVGLTLAALSVSVMAGCSSDPTEGDLAASEGDTGTTVEEALSRSSAVSRAEEWSNARLHYCQSPRGESDPDAACWPHEGGSHRCNRASHGRWDAYRSDCSGLVSWAWGIPAPGRTTYGFAPYDNSVSHTISARSLSAGDAVNNRDHVMLFKKWNSPGSSAVFIEEPGCSSSEPFAHEVSSHVSISGGSIYVDALGMSFNAIRFNRIGGSAPSGGGSGGGGTTSGGGSSGGGGGGQGCHSATLGRGVPDNACVQSRSDSRWYQCDNGAWVDRWTDPTACNGVHPL